MALEIQGWGSTSSFKRFSHRCWYILKISKHQPKLTTWKSLPLDDNFQTWQSLTTETQNSNYINAVSRCGKQDCLLSAKCWGYHYLPWINEFGPHTHLTTSMNVCPCSLHISKWRPGNWKTCPSSHGEEMTRWGSCLLPSVIWITGIFSLRSISASQNGKKTSPWLPSISLYFSSRDTKLF